MKVYDIISEAESIILGPDGKPFQLPDVPGTGTPDRPTPAPGKDKGIKDVITGMRNRIRRKQRNVVRYERIFDDKYGWPTRQLFKLIGITAAIYNTWEELDALDEMYITGEIKTLQKLEETREFVWGSFATVALTPIILRAIANTKVVIGIARWIKNGLAVLSAPVTAGGSIAVAVASEAFIAFLQWWLTTDAGRDWLTKYAMGYIRAVGKPFDYGQDKLMAAFNQFISSDQGGKYISIEKEKEARQNKAANKSGQASVSNASDTEEKPTTPRKIPAGEKSAPVSSETYPEEIRYESQNRVFVGDEVVTDFEGYLIPGIQNVLAVQGARADAKRLGLADPLQGIPVRPGGVVPKPLP